MTIRTDIEEYIAAGEAFLRGDIDQFPTGVYRAHRSIVPWTCAHCGTEGRAGKPIGYCSALPAGHKVICGHCFYGSTT